MSPPVADLTFIIVLFNLLPLRTLKPFFFSWSGNFWHSQQWHIWLSTQLVKCAQLNIFWSLCTLSKVVHGHYALWFNIPTCSSTVSDCIWSGIFLQLLLCPRLPTDSWLCRVDLQVNFGLHFWSLPLVPETICTRWDFDTQSLDPAELQGLTGDPMWLISLIRFCHGLFGSLWRLPGLDVQDRCVSEGGERKKSSCSDHFCTFSFERFALF